MNFNHIQCPVKLLDILNISRGSLKQKNLFPEQMSSSDISIDTSDDEDGSNRFRNSVTRYPLCSNITLKMKISF